jgi:protoporphyrinogen oxidase
MASRHLTILGGGLAGLSVGHFARTSRLSFVIYEASDRLGGNCVTWTHGDFRFDSGAHRLHDKEPGITAEMARLLGPDLKRLIRPSFYYRRGKFLEYPLSRVNLMRSLGPVITLRAAFDIAVSRARPARPQESFEDHVIMTYGRTLARQFLVSYTEKLWGTPCGRLAPDVADKRFHGLGLKTLADQALRGRKGRQEGIYFYPDGGIGAIAGALSASCGEASIRSKAPVTRLEHDGRRIRRVETGGRSVAEVDEVISTIPLHQLVRSLDPAPPREVLDAAARLRFRNVILAAFPVSRPSVTEAATIYIGDPDISIIRVYEPRNRDPRMSPPGKTSLVAELPCDADGEIWSLPDKDLIRLARTDLEKIGLVKESELGDACIRRMPHAYPVPDLGLLEEARRVLAFLGTFANLKLSGRCGKHRYLWMHEVMAAGQHLVEGYLTA